MRTMSFHHALEQLQLALLGCALKQLCLVSACITLQAPGLQGGGM